MVRNQVDPLWASVRVTNGTKGNRKGVDCHFDSLGPGVHCLRGARKYDESCLLSTADALDSKSECTDGTMRNSVMHASAIAKHIRIVNAMVESSAQYILKRR